MAKKKAKKQHMEKKEEFFVGLNDPASVRLALLECTKKVLESMKLFQEIKSIRIQKIEEKNKLRKQLKKISSTIRNINSIMPHMPTLSEPARPVKQEKEKEPVAPREEAKPMPKTEIDRIEAELAEIEDKLSSLS